MDLNTISISGIQKLILRAAGDLYLRAWDEANMLGISGGEMIETLQEGDLLRITSVEDLHLSVPAGLQVLAERVGGDAYVTMVESVELRQVGGDVMILGAASASVLAVGGDLQAKDVARLSVQSVGGDFESQNVSLIGSCRVGGDFEAHLSSDAAASISAGGDIEAALQPAAGNEISLRAGGDLELSLAADASAELDIHSGSHDILIHRADRDEEIEKRDYLVTLGSGGVKIHLSAGGDVVVTDDVWEEDDLADEFVDMVEDMDRSFERASRRGVDRIAHITARVEDASRRAQDRIDAAMRRMEQRGHRFGVVAPIAPIPPMPFAPSAPAAPPEPVVKEGASEEERMLILKMLQDKKITVEEAEKLLEALES